MSYKDAIPLMAEEWAGTNKNIMSTVKNQIEHIEIILLVTIIQ